MSEMNVKKDWKNPVMGVLAIILTAGQVLMFVIYVVAGLFVTLGMGLAKDPAQQAYSDFLGRVLAGMAVMAVMLVLCIVGSFISARNKKGTKTAGAIICLIGSGVIAICAILQYIFVAIYASEVKINEVDILWTVLVSLTLVYAVLRILLSVKNLRFKEPVQPLYISSGY